MTTATKTTKPARSFRFLTAFSGTNAATIQITQRRGNARPDIVDYNVEFVEADPELGACGVIFSKVFEEVKPRGMTSQSYQVLVNSNGVGVSCTCAGSLHHGHCRHRDLVPMLLKARKGN